MGFNSIKVLNSFRENTYSCWGNVKKEKNYINKLQVLWSNYHLATSTSKNGQVSTITVVNASVLAVGSLSIDPWVVGCASWY